MAESVHEKLRRVRKPGRPDPVAHALRGLAAVIEEELKMLPEEARPKELRFDLKDTRCSDYAERGPSMTPLEPPQRSGIQTTARDKCRRNSKGAGFFLLWVFLIVLTCLSGNSTFEYHT